MLLDRLALPLLPLGRRLPLDHLAPLFQLQGRRLLLEALVLPFQPLEALVLPLLPLGRRLPQEALVLLSLPLKVRQRQLQLVEVPVHQDRLLLRQVRQRQLLLRLGIGQMKQ